ncbi:MAG: hypothetical protein WCT28_02525 [Patescibacteria group bacterium]|jgi:hypothetical protein
MLGIAISLPTTVLHYINTTPLPLIAAQALLVVGWIPIFGVIIWGLTHIWMDYKQGKYNAALRWQLLEIRVPQDAINTPKGMENFFMNISGVKSAITWREVWLIGKFQSFFSLEIVGSEGNVRFLIRTIDKYRDLVEAALYAQYPEAQIIEVDDYVDVLPNEYPNEEFEVFGSEMVFAEKSYFPIRTYKEFEHQGEKDFRFKDPLLPIIEFLGKMKEREYFWIQIIIQPPDSQTLVKEGAEYLNAMMGKEKKQKPSAFGALAENVLWLPKGILTQVAGVGFGEAAHEEKKDDFRMFRMTSHERLIMDAVAEKISKVTWKTKIRWVSSGPKKKFSRGLMASSAKGMFATFNHQYMNRLGLFAPSVPKNDYIWQEWQMAGKQRKLVSRYKRRSGGEGADWLYMNVEELATLFHFPAADARTPVLSNVGARRAEAPDTLSFASKEDPQLPNWKRTIEETKEEERVRSLPESELLLPTPTSPTEHANVEQIMPAAIRESDVPPNLPI